MSALVRAAWVKIRADLAEQVRYPVQFVFGWLTTGAVLWGLGLAAARTSGTEAGVGALATYVAMGAVSLFYLIPRLLAGGKDHPPEEAMLYPYPLARMVAVLASVSAVQIALGLIGVYLLAALAVTRHAPAIGVVLGGMALALLGAAGAGFLLFALKLVFRQVDGLAVLVQLGFFAAAFAPGLRPDWIAAVPVAGAVRWLREPELSPLPVLLFGFLWVFIGLLAVARAERAVVARGVAGYE